MSTGLVLGLLAAPLAVGFAVPASAVSATVVINEVYGGGGNSGAAFQNDFIELKNISAGPLSLDGLSVQYRAAGGMGASTNVVSLPAVNLPAGQTYLIQAAAGAANPPLAPLPTPDASSGINLSGTGGQVYLASVPGGIDPNTPAGAAGSTFVGEVIDFVGWGSTTTSFEGTRAAATTNPSSVSRNGAGADTDVNSADLTVTNPPTPTACVGCAVTPPGEFEGSIAQIQGDGATTPYAGDTVTTTGVVTASYPTGGFNGFVLQTGGSGGATNPTAGSDAIFVWGGNDGFASFPAVGASLEVTGTAVEGGGPATGLTQIEVFDDADVVPVTPALAPVTPRAIALPTTNVARETHESELLSPTNTFTVTNSFNTNKFADVGLATGTTPLRQWTDAARPGTPEAQAVKDDNAARAITLDDGASIDFLPFGGGANQNIALPWLTPATATSPATPVRVGARAELKVPLVLEFRFGSWRLQPRAQVTAATDQDTAAFTNTREARPKNVGGDLTLATFNVLNYFNTTGQAWVAAAPGRSCEYFNDRAGNPIGVDRCTRGPGDAAYVQGPRGAATTASLARQQAKIVRALNNMDADIVSLEEIENSVGLGESDRDDALNALVAALNAQAGSTRWDYAKSPEASALPPVADQDVIRNAFIFNPDTVSRVGQSQVLTGSAAFENAREPLAQAFKPEGAPNSDAFAVVVNHFKSKSSGASSNPGNTDTGDGQGAFNGDRTRQAAALVTFANSFATSRGTSKVFLTGDFNSYTQEDPMQVLYGAGYDVIESDTPGEYSYSFSGLSGSLDHVLANPAAMAMKAGSDIWESNANESVAYQYSRFNYNLTDLYSATPYAASDHNPEVVGLNTDGAPTTVKNVQVLGTNDFHGRLTRNPGGTEAGAAVLAGAVKQLRAQNPNTIFAAAGDLIGASTFDSFIQNDKPTLDALNEAGLDVSSVGNHEFDQGYDDLVNRVMAAYDPDDNPEGGAEWKYLGANVKFRATGNPALPATWIKDFGNVEVGFVGAVTEDLPSLVSPDGIADIQVTDIVEATNEEAASLKDEGADVVVLLVHEGATTTAYADAVDPGSKFGKIVNGVDADVDAIISGHTHLAYNHRVPVPEWAAQDRAVTKRPVVSAGQYGANLNRLRFRVDATTGEVLGIRTSILALQTSDGAATATFTPNYPEDAATKAIVDDAVAKANVLGAVPLGKISGPLNRAKLANGSTENRGGESTLGNLVAEVQQWATESPTTGSAQIAFMNPGGLRADIVPAADGTVTYRQAATTQSFANTLVNMDLTGAQIKSVLEQQWQPAGSSRPFLRLGVSEGFTYTYDPAKPAGSRITAMHLDGTPIQPGTTYSVTANSFLASGGDNFTAFAGGTSKQDTGQSDLEAVVDYFAEFASGSTPLQVDYSQRAVGSAFPADAPASYGPGSPVTFSLSSLAMSTAADTEDGTVSVSLGGVALGSFPVDNTIGTDIRDEYGTSSVTVTLPANAPGGPTNLVVDGASTGTQVLVPITVTGGGSTSPTPSVPAPAATALSGSIAGFTYGEAGSVTATITPATAAGKLDVLHGSRLVGTGTLSGGKATVALTARSLKPGTYTLSLRYAGDAGHAPSASTVSVTVQKVTPDLKVVAPKKVDRGDRAKVKVMLSADNDVPVRGKVEVDIKGGKTLTGRIKDGKVVFKLPRFSETGKVTLTVAYLGSDLAARESDRVTIKVVRR